MKKKFNVLMFKIMRYLIWLFYPKTEIVGMENIPDEPCIIVGNHSQMDGPLVCEFYFPDNTYTWCASEMMELKKVPAYAFEDFWSNKPKCVRPLYKLLSCIIAPFSMILFSNARTIGVYRGTKIMNTFKETVSMLKEGRNIVIFPEHYVPHNNIVHDFQEGFVNVARLYHKQTGGELSFVPLYVAPAFKKAYLGKPVRFSADAPIEEERRRICDYLMDAITDIAVNLPEHTVTPYPNISKKLYPKNTEKGIKL